MTVAEVVSKVRRRTQTDTTTYPNANVLVDMNVAINTLGSYIGAKREGVLGMIAYQGLTADEREYVLPSACQKVERLFVMLDGVNYIEVEEVDPKLVKLPVDEDDISGMFSNAEGSVVYTNFRKHIKIYSRSIPEQANGLMLEYISRFNLITDATSTTDLSEPQDGGTSGYAGIPHEFHPVLIPMISRQYKLDNNMVQQLTDDESLELIERTIMRTIANAVVPINNQKEFLYTGQRRSSRYNNGFDL